MILETTNLRSVPAGMGKSSETFPSGLFATPWRFTGDCVVDVYPVTMPPARSDMRAQLLSAPPGQAHLACRSTVAGCVRRAGSNPAALNRIHCATAIFSRWHNESVTNRAVCSTIRSTLLSAWCY